MSSGENEYFDNPPEIENCDNSEVEEQKVNPANYGYEEAVIEVCMDDDPLNNPSSSNTQSAYKKKTDDDLIKDAYKNMNELIETAKTAFSETTPVRTFLHSLALQIEEANLSFDNMSMLQMEMLNAVHNAIKRENMIPL